MLETNIHENDLAFWRNMLEDSTRARLSAAIMIINSGTSDLDDVDAAHDIIKNHVGELDQEKLEDLNFSH